MKTWLTLTKLVAVSATLTILAPVASAQVEYPPAEVVVTVAPVYYEGHAAYWWHNRWYYRDAHGHWGHYATEPRFLHDHRFSHRFDRHYYAGGYHRR